MNCFHMPIKIFAESEGFYWTVGAPEGGFMCCFGVVTMISQLGQFINLQKIWKGLLQVADSWKSFRTGRTCEGIWF
jgi:hypothetical protein